MNLSVNRPAGLARIQLSNTSVAPLSREVFLTGISVLPFAANQYIPVCLRSQSFLHSFQSQRHDRVPLGLCWETPTSPRAFLALRQIRQLTHRRRSGRESRPGDSHPEALAGPDVTLSRHPALIREPPRFMVQLANRYGLRRETAATRSRRAFSFRAHDRGF